MCLDKLRKFKVPVYGYKIFRVNDATDKLFSVFQGESKSYPVNKILDEKYFRTEYNKKQKNLYYYPYGFHIFKSLKTAKIKYANTAKIKYANMVGVNNYAIYKVKIIEPHTTGLEFNIYGCSQVIVSKKMKIIHRMPIKIIFDNTICRK